MKPLVYTYAQKCSNSSDLLTFNATDDVAHCDNGAGRDCVSISSFSSKQLLAVFDAGLEQIAEYVGILEIAEEFAVVSVRHQFAGFTHDTYIPAIGSNFDKLRSIADGENKLVICLEADDSDVALIVETELLPMQSFDFPVQHEYSNAELLEIVELVESLDTDVSDVSKYTRCVILPEELMPPLH